MSGARGEGTILTDERGEVQVLYTNRALFEAEKSMGCSVIAALQGIQTNETGITEVAHLLRAGMEAARRDARSGGRPISLSNAFEVLDDAGFIAVINVVAEAVAAVISYGEEDADPNA